jgi:hypothetical protein
LGLARCALLIGVEANDDTLDLDRASMRLMTPSAKSETNAGAGPSPWLTL